MAFQIKHFIARNGERFSQLYNYPSDGFPLFYPTAYSVRNLRTGVSHSTQIAYLNAIKKFYEWEESTHQPKGLDPIDIHERLLTKKFLKPYEVDSMASFVAAKKGSQTGEMISGQKANVMLQMISKYLMWYAEEVITDSNQPVTQSAIKKLESMIASRKYKQASKARVTQQMLAKQLPEDTREELLSLFLDPLRDVYKQSEQAPRFRNVLALRILYETGMRQGELLGLKLQDFKLGYGGEPDLLTVSRYHDDARDDRQLQPVAKTLERPVPISSELARSIIEYIKDWRAKAPIVGFENHDPLLVIHKQGGRQGKAMTTSGLQSMLDVLAKKYPALKCLHPHLLRHDWNYRFSLAAKEKGYTEQQETDEREFLMGWVEGSESAKRYNRRRIQEQAFEIGLQVASHTATRRAK